MLTQLEPSLDPQFLMFEFDSGLNPHVPDLRLPAVKKAKLKAVFNKFTRLKLGMRTPQPRPSTIWCHTTTANQYEMIMPVIECLGQRAFDWNLFHPFDYWSLNDRATLPRHRQSAQERWPDAPTESHLDLYALAIWEAALLETAMILGKPRAVLTANDHSPRHMALRYAAKRSNTPLFYLQHAAVGGVEPPLTGLDGAFLHGTHAKTHYENSGPLPAKTYLVGSPKLDISPRRQILRQKLVGICPGLHAELATTRRVIAKLSANIPTDYALQLRLHPRHRTSLDWANLIRDVNATKLPSNQNTQQFLKSCSIIVSDDSNVALEAPAVGCKVVRTAFSTQFSDQYKIGDLPFYRKWTVPLDRLIETLQAAIIEQDSPALQEIASHFFADIGSTWQGHSAQRISDVLTDEFLAQSTGF